MSTDAKVSAREIEVPRPRRTGITAISSAIAAASSGLSMIRQGTSVPSWA
jgi:hypothetical protein